ncbi:CYTH domain-containing protein [Tichowtungia aerotolerans]|uniref:Uncharacterized protein n=1 Tax=Tichowtungia aerotolerans TaxID=2697043 RepID=A0A6P1MBD8_9BACT|nr:hypothetical protein [Tichowtungia aerotolerans]QHI68425.1 hypothetical protein GT409_02790 [Tichowtungia aerotolerans]
MKMSRTILGILFGCAVICAGADGMRIWRTQSGERIEGRFVRVLLGKVQIETSAGEKEYIPLGELSEWDKKHLSSIFIPKVNIKFSDSSRAKFRSKNALADDIIRIVTGTVVVEAKDNIESDTLRMEVYLIGEEVADDGYRLLRKASKPLSFNEENDYTCQMSLETESRRYMEYNYQLRGCLYAGYVVIIFDRQDHPVEFKTDLSWITEDRLDALRGFEEEDFFSDQLKSRPIPRPKYSNARVGVQ